ncbi:MAG: hypothetical protein B7Y86_05000 [Brevundimonas subvibrioides]|uniref:MFS transporter n=1 Tax=Brevundimonas subvibrioides TaxID=74313 RepID=A0A258HLH8_9CAUL|nr:DUF5690 family protein [Brevundimonas subvibrioides]OYX57831.1 MAG: hypothetical protein B7Y86_05000 [Brevundimonas subvibrioides]
MNRLRLWLARANPVIFVLFAGLAGFCAYFSMYAFRKPFTAATFDLVPGWEFALDYKIALVIAQVAGYALSKLIGVKVIAEMRPERRAGAIVILIGASWIALVLFAVVPAPWNVAALFLNGLPLGLIWGLVFGFMEGRRTSEVLGAILCASFILSSGVVKSVGKTLMDGFDVSAFWMPAAVGVVFMPLLAVSVLALAALPPPSDADEAERVARRPMMARERAAFLAAHWPVLLLLVAAYVMLTAFRDLRDNFAAEIWQALGYGDAASVFTASEGPVAVLSLIAMGVMIAVKNNGRALLLMHGVILAGFAILGASTLAFQHGLLSPIAWMIVSGAGLYLAYTPFNAMLFDRLIAYSGTVATAGFLIYVADASGYVGSVILLLVRNFAAVDLPWLRFFVGAAYATSLVGLVLVTGAAVLFLRRRVSGPVRDPTGGTQ